MDRPWRFHYAGLSDTLCLAHRTPHGVDAINYDPIAVSANL
jgi:hypothetical protein